MRVARFLSPVIGTVAAGILALSSGAKLYSIASKAPSGYLTIGWFHLVAFVTAVELVLAVSLLIFRFSPTVLALTVSLFGAFALVTGTLLKNGITNCGCLGAVDTSVVWIFVLDVALFAILLGALIVSNGVREIQWPIVCSCAVVVTLFGGFVFALDAGWMPTAFANAMGRFRGDDVVMNPPVIDLGKGMPREVRRFELRVRNLSDKKIQFLGQLSPGNWELESAAPIEIGPNEETTLAVLFRFPKTPGLFADFFTQYLNSPNRQVLRIAYRGHCRANIVDDE